MLTAYQQCNPAQTLVLHRHLSCTDAETTGAHNIHSPQPTAHANTSLSSSAQHAWHTSIGHRTARVLQERAEGAYRGDAAAFKAGAPFGCRLTPGSHTGINISGRQPAEQQ